MYWFVEGKKKIPNLEKEILGSPLDLEREWKKKKKKNSRGREQVKERENSGKSTG